MSSRVRASVGTSTTKLCDVALNSLLHAMEAKVPPSPPGLGELHGHGVSFGLSQTAPIDKEPRRVREKCTVEAHGG